MTKKGKESDLPGAKSDSAQAIKWAILVGVFIHVGGAFIFRFVSAPLPQQEVERPFVSYLPQRFLDEDLGLMEQAELFDTAPLFIPTPWSAYSLEVPVLAMKPENLFDHFEPTIDLVESLKRGADYQDHRYIVADAIDFVLRKNPEELTSFGTGPSRASQVEEPWYPVVRVRVFRDDGRISNDSLSLPLQMKEIPDSIVTESSVRFGLRSSRTGMLLMRPFVIDSSGSVSIDRSLAEWLSRPQSIASLPRGYIEVEFYL